MIASCALAASLLRHPTFHRFNRQPPEFLAPERQHGAVILHGKRHIVAAPFAMSGPLASPFLPSFHPDELIECDVQCLAQLEERRQLRIEPSCRPFSLDRDIMDPDKLA